MKKKIILGSILLAFITAICMHKNKCSAQELDFDDGFDAGVEAVTSNPNDYGLYTQSQYNEAYNLGLSAGFDSGYDAGVEAVTSNPNDYGLYTQSQYNEAYNNGYQTAINYVIAHPNEFGLYTQSQYNERYSSGYDEGYDEGYDIGHHEGYGEGEQYVTSNPHSYNLYTYSEYLAYHYQGIDAGYDAGVRDSRAELEEREQFGYENGIQYVLDNLNEFGLANNEMLEQAYKDGENFGYNKGLEEGQKTFSSIWDFVKQMFLGLGSIMDIEVLPSIKIGYIVAIPIVFGLFAFIVGVFK